MAVVVVCLIVNAQFAAVIAKAFAVDNFKSNKSRLKRRQKTLSRIIALWWLGSKHVRVAVCCVRFRLFDFLNLVF